MSGQERVNPMLSRVRNPCPHCGARMLFRYGRYLHPLMIRFYARCESEACGFSAVGQSELTHELCPSQQQNPDVQLPKSQDSLRREAAVTYRRQFEGRQLDMADLLEQA